MLQKNDERTKKKPTIIFFLFFLVRLIVGCFALLLLFKYRLYMH